MRIDFYVNYRGTCEEAFRFYAEHLGGRVVTMMTHGQLPPEAGPSRLPPGWEDKVLHARLELGNAAITGADIPNAEPMRSAYVTLTLDSVADAERVYGLLGDRGEIFMKLDETFFALRFAMLRDRFGTSWMLIHDRPTQGRT